MEKRVWMSYLVIAVLWLIPLLLVAFSGKTRGREKLAWTVLTVGGGAFVWLAYFILAPVTGESGSEGEPG